ncbi:MAG: YibE/F family protein [Gemmatimonadales bacterium]
MRDRWKADQLGGAVHDLAMSRRWRRGLQAASVGPALATQAGMIALRPDGSARRPDLKRLGVISAFHDGVVKQVEPGACPNVPADSGVACDLAYRFADRDRRPTPLWLGLIFALATVALGRLRGVTALVGLAASLAVLLSFALPAVIDGRSPIAVAIVAAAAISFPALYLAHGFTGMTTVALLGTLASLALTAVLAVGFVGAARFSGFGSEEAGFLAIVAESINLRGLLVSGVVIGALGAIDDMAVTQASAIAELHAVDPRMGSRRLYRAGLRIGRDHVASTVNTLALAYAGASMPLPVLFVLSGRRCSRCQVRVMVASQAWALPPRVPTSMTSRPPSCVGRCSWPRGSMVMSNWAGSIDSTRHPSAKLVRISSLVTRRGPQSPGSMSLKASMK